MRTRTDAETAQLKVRIKEPLRAAIERDATARGVTMNAAIVDRLELSMREQGLTPLLQILSRVMRDAGVVASLYTGRSVDPYSDAWLGDAFAYDQAVAAAVFVLEKLRPAGDRSPPLDISKPLVVVSDPGFPAVDDEAGRLARIGESIAAGALEAIANPERGGEIGDWARPIRDRLGAIAARIKL